MCKMPEYFEDAHNFNPSRFDPENRKLEHRFVYYCIKFLFPGQIHLCISHLVLDTGHVLEGILLWSVDSKSHLISCIH